MSSDTYLDEIRQELGNQLHARSDFQGEVNFDRPSRLLYSTDASIYQIEPLGVVFPRCIEDLSILMSVAATLNIPIVPRGAGSSLAGQAVGSGLVVDCSRHLNRIMNIDPEEQTAYVEPGVVLAALNRRASAHGLQFGPDPASAERATVGGSIANNATGAHSIQYGMLVDHLFSVDAVLADGSFAKFSSHSLELARHLAAGQGSQADLYRSALQIRESNADDIRAIWPKTWRRVSGYNLNYLLPWSPSQPPQWAQSSQEWMHSGQGGLGYPSIDPNEINLSSLIAGSEGTLAVVHGAKLRLVPRPRHTILGVLSFPSIATACDHTPELLRHAPAAVELIPYSLVYLARTVPAYADQLSFLDQLLIHSAEKGALLVVEFCGDNPAALRQQALAIGRGVWLAESLEVQKKIWTVRKVGLGILMSRLGSQKPTAFIEDIAVPVEVLGNFVRGVDDILQDFGVTAEVYAHASAGCLHIRPILDLKSSSGLYALRQIAVQVVELALRLGGAITGEHGDGIARGEWIAQAYGPTIMQAFRQVKHAADPKGLLNPGKIINPPPMDTWLRYGEGYHAEGWQPVFQYEPGVSGEQGLLDAIEHCNGAGVCRKSDGVMCPSFQASQEEMHSTRGRANLLRAFVSGQFENIQAGEQAVREALDLCLACKGCKSECPSGVDIARLKYEFTDHYYSELTHRRPWRDYLFGYIDRFARLGQPFARLANPLLASRPARSLLQRTLAISAQRSLPALAVHTLSHQIKQLPAQKSATEEVIFLSDAFSEFFTPAAGIATAKILRAAGIKIHCLPISGAGRTLISKGFLHAARDHARRVIAAVQKVDQDGKMPIIGIEPSEIYTLRDEYQDLFPQNEYVAGLAGRAWMIDEYLLRPDGSGTIRVDKICAGMHPPIGKVYLHGHCYQKSQSLAPDGYPVGVAASEALLQRVGYAVQQIDSGCCGMAGSFGYESEHHSFSLQVAELALLPAVRAAPQDALIAAAGVSCQAQIQDGGQRQARHPIELVGNCLVEG